MTKTKQLIPGAAVVAIISIMIAAAELTGQNEIIFPEIMGLAVGYIAAPVRGWKATPARMTATIAVCALVGVLIVRYVPLPMWLQLTLAFVCGQIVLAMSGTSFGPLLSAAALPVLMQTESIVYPVSAILMTALSGGVAVLLEKTGVLPENDFTPFPVVFDVWQMVKKTACVAVFALAVISLGIKFCIAPPLIVAFNEFVKPQAHARKRPVAAVILVFACASIGAVLRGLLTIKLGLPLTLAAALTVVLILVLMKRMRMYTPPAGAMGILAMLVPAEVLPLYPFEVLIGITVFVILAMGLWKNERI